MSFLLTNNLEKKTVDKKAVMLLLKKHIDPIVQNLMFQQGI